MKKDYQSDQMNNAATAAGFGLIMGALGLVAGLLLAPKSGKETRADLTVKSKELHGRAKNAAKEFKDSAKTKASKVQDTAEDLKKIAKDKSEELHGLALDAKNIAKETKDEATRTIKKNS